MKVARCGCSANIAEHIVIRARVLDNDCVELEWRALCCGKTWHEEVLRGTFETLRSEP